MRINVRDLAGAKVGEPLPFSLESAAPGFDDLPAVTGLAAAGAVEQLGDRFLVRGTVTATARLGCVRCLKNFDYPVRAEFAEEFARKPNEDQFPAGETVLDVTEMLRATVLLALPDRPLHDPDCRGLCDVCGKDLNEEPHEHPERAKSKENPFSKLKEKPK